MYLDKTRRFLAVSATVFFLGATWAQAQVPPPPPPVVDTDGDGVPDDDDQCQDSDLSLSVIIKKFGVRISY